MPRKKSTVSTNPETVERLCAEIIQQTNAFCKEFLTEEYAELCRELAMEMAGFQPLPFARGKLNGWAAGIVYAIGAVNFLHDPSQTPTMRLGDIGPEFGVSPATTAARAKEIRDNFEMISLDPRWCLPSRLDDNPLAWIVEVNGLLVDARRAPREFQEHAVQSGLIPYLPEPISDPS